MSRRALVLPAIAVAIALLTGCQQPVSTPSVTGVPAAAPVTPMPSPVANRVPLVVFAAGSLIVPFDALEAAFEAQTPDIDVRSEYHGSIQVIRHATELHEPIDVVATADATLIPTLMYAMQDPDTGRPYADWYIRFASNRLALAYAPGSRYAGEITADNWPEILARSDVRVGLADPRFDAAGYRGLMAFALAQERDGRYDYFRRMFDGQFVAPVTVFLDDNGATVTVPEVLETRSGSHVVLRGASIQLVALLQSGDLDYAFEYESVIRQRKLESLTLPDEVNLGSAAHEAAYGRVLVKLDFRRFATVKPQFRGERIGYGITIPSNAPHPAEAARFIAFLLGAEGRAIMEAQHHPLFDRPIADGYERVPTGLQAMCSPPEPP